MQRCISFDLLRSSLLPCSAQLKPAQMYQHASLLQDCDWVLFPEYWQLNALLYGFRVKVFPSPATYYAGHNKIEMTRVFQAIAPAHTPETRIHANTPLYAETVWDGMSVPFVAKLPKSARGEGVWLIENRDDWQAYLHRTDIIYAQEYLPIDRDLRIVIVGKEILAGYWRLQGHDGFHNNLSRGGEIHHGPVPEAALDLVRQVAAGLGIDHAGFDVAMVGQHPYLLEFNRLFGNQGIRDGDRTVQNAIRHYLQAQSDPQLPDKPTDQLPTLITAA